MAAGRPVLQGRNLSNVTINVNGLNSPNKDTDSRCPIIAIGKIDLKLDDSETENEREMYLEITVEKKAQVAVFAPNEAEFEAKEHLAGQRMWEKFQLH